MTKQTYPPGEQQRNFFHIGLRSHRAGEPVGQSPTWQAYV
jgi:hypothetical protein